MARKYIIILILWKDEYNKIWQEIVSDFEYYIIIIWHMCIVAFSLFRVHHNKVM